MQAEHTFVELSRACRDQGARLALVLGSGMGPVIDRWGRSHQVGFADIPGLTATGVQGHRGQLSLLRVRDVPVLVWEGRLHFYEGHAWERVVRPTEVSHELGVRAMFHTNAAGGIRGSLLPGSLMVIRDHIEWTTPYPWRGSGSGSQSSPYAERPRALLRAVADSIGITTEEGVYASLTGPCYETRAEIRALKACGADAVGMSTAREVGAAVELGMDCVAVSCITNQACGLSDAPLSHEEVLAVARTGGERLGLLIEAFVAQSAELWK